MHTACKRIAPTIDTTSENSLKAFLNGGESDVASSHYARRLTRRHCSFPPPAKQADHRYITCATNDRLQTYRGVGARDVAVLPKSAAKTCRRVQRAYDRGVAVSAGKTCGALRSIYKTPTVSFILEGLRPRINT